MSVISSSLRKEYTQSKLMETDLESNPFDQFHKWFNDAVSAELPLPNAMTLATVKQDQTPAARVVLLKELDQRGFVFYTNYQSAKAEELEYQNKASLVFWWISQERQVRIEGFTEKVTESESEAYFATRPRESQLSAWASDQSKPVSGRPELETKRVGRLSFDPFFL
jgi:pyridoxamine 5'-phosphate oxidase